MNVEGRTMNEIPWDVSFTVLPFLEEAIDAFSVLLPGT
jgi:hypothetical protein